MKKISYLPNLLRITRVLSEENDENLEKKCAARYAQCAIHQN
jgi:hypothetical protein